MLHIILSLRKLEVYNFIVARFQMLVRDQQGPTQASYEARG